MSKLRLGVLASGRGSNLQSIIDVSSAGKLPAEVAVVVSDQGEAYALKRAQAARIPAVFVDPKTFGTREEYEAAVVEVLRTYDVDLVCLAGYMLLVGERLLSAYPNKILNIHPALLPSFPGLHAQRQALEYGVKYSGCTVHFVDGGMDSGPVILQAAVPVLENDTEDSLAARILEQEHRLYPEAIRLYAEGKLTLEGRRVKISE